MKLTTNYGLKKPEGSDIVNVDDLNYNADIIDNAITEVLAKANEAFQRGDNVKTQLVDKLISEGINASTGNTFEELIGKITSGKKWAQGSAKSSASPIYEFSQSAPSSIEVTGLTFTPSIIVAASGGNGYGVFYYGPGYWNSSINAYPYKCLTYRITSSAVTAKHYSEKVGIVISDGHFILPVEETSKTYKWICFE